jgi:hypothetical protein
MFSHSSSLILYQHSVITVFSGYFSSFKNPWFYPDSNPGMPPLQDRHPHSKAVMV